MGVPNAAALYSNEDTIYGENGYRPETARGGYVKRAIANKMGEYIVSKTPRSDSKGVLGESYNAALRGLATSFNAGKHENAKKALDNTIPGLRKIIQNGWSFYYLKDGVTTIDSIYTLERGGKEYMLHVKRDGETVNVSDLANAASVIQGKETEHAYTLNQKIQTGEFEDSNAVRAGVYYELTDGDIQSRKLLDLGKLTNRYQLAEGWLIANRGKKTVVGTTAAGERINRYSKPSKSEFFKFYGNMDVLYTALSLTALPAEKILTDKAAQNVYEAEAQYSIDIIKSNYAGNVDIIGLN